MDRKISRSELYELISSISYSLDGKPLNSEVIRNYTLEVDRENKKTIIQVYDNPVEIRVGNQWLDIKEALGVTDDLLRKLRNELSESELEAIEDYETLSKVFGGNHQESTIVLDTDDPTGISVRSREYIRPVKDVEHDNGVKLPREFVWVDGASNISGTIILPWSDYDKVYVVSDPDKDGNYELVWVDPKDETQENQPRPFYEKKDGKTFIYVDHFSGGGGTQTDPYLIHTEDDLYNIRTLSSSAWYVLANDIIMSKYTTGQGWEPLTFTGTLDGRGYKIKGLYINRGQDQVGLIGYLKGTVKNLKLENVKIINDHSTDSWLYYTGSLVGYMDGGTIQKCAAVSGDIEVKVQNGHYVGGLVGYLNNGVIYDSYSHVNVATYGDQCGGFVGQQRSHIYRSYSTGKVVDLTIAKTSSYHGGFSGYHYSGNSYDCFWDIDTSGKTSSGNNNDHGLTKSQMKDRINYQKLDDTGGYIRYDPWDFNTVWWDDTTLDYNNGYPELRPFVHYKFGKGTEQDPFIVSTEEDLNQVRHFPWAHFKQGNDIKMTKFQTGEGFTPIGESSSYDVSFHGTYDGNGFVIGNLYINRPSDNHIGLFRYINRATLKNIRIVDCDITGNQYTGSLVGYAHDYRSDIKNCSAESYKGATVRGTSSYAGGLIGALFGGSVVEDSYTNLLVTSSSSYAAGFVGSIDNGHIYRSYSKSTIQSSSSYASGFVGYMTNTGSEIRNCYADGEITGSSTIGFVGYFYQGSIYNCYSSCILSSGNKYGFNGNKHSSAYGSWCSWSECYFDRERAGTTNTDWAGVAKFTAEMKHPATFLASKGWDSTIWVLDSKYNDGYPELVVHLPIETPILGFMNEFGKYFTDNKGNVLRYLEFGTLIAGQTSQPKEVYVQNNADFPITSLRVWVDSVTVKPGITAEISIGKNPFVPTNEITFAGTYGTGESAKFYVRFSSDVDVKEGGTFDLRAKASPV